METRIFWNSCMWKIEDWFVVMKRIEIVKNGEDIG